MEKEITMLQKDQIRALRHYAKRIAKARNYANWDLEVFGAPEECYRDVEKSFERKIKKAFEIVGITKQEFEEALKGYWTKEAKYMQGIEPPDAYYDLLTLNI